VVENKEKGKIVMNLILAIAAGGAIGAVGRHFVIGLLSAPWGTLTVNVIGSFLMGVLIEIIALRWSVSIQTQAFLATGVLGAFTTFSTFSLDVATISRDGSLFIPMVYVLASVVGAICALFLGLFVVRTMLSP